MNVTIESSGSVVIAYLIGEIDHHTAGEVREKIDDTLMLVKPKTLILDFKNCQLYGLLRNRSCYGQIQIASKH